MKRICTHRNKQKLSHILVRVGLLTQECFFVFECFWSKTIQVHSWPYSG